MNDKPIFVFHHNCWRSEKYMYVFGRFLFGSLVFGCAIVVVIFSLYDAAPRGIIASVLILSFLAIFVAYIGIIDIYPGYPQIDLQICSRGFYHYTEPLINHLKKQKKLIEYKDVVRVERVKNDAFSRIIIYLSNGRVIDVNSLHISMAGVDELANQLKRYQIRSGKDIMWRDAAAGLFWKWYLQREIIKRSKISRGEKSG